MGTWLHSVAAEQRAERVLGKDGKGKKQVSKNNLKYQYAAMAQEVEHFLGKDGEGKKRVFARGTKK